MVYKINKSLILESISGRIKSAVKGLDLNRKNKASKIKDLRSAADKLGDKNFGKQYNSDSNGKLVNKFSLRKEARTIKDSDINKDVGTIRPA